MASVDYIGAKNGARTNAEQSGTGADFRVSFESDELSSVVYFIGCINGLVKIGFAKDFETRLSQLVCGSPVPLHPLAMHGGGRVEEGRYHQRFRKWRSHGEWFYLTDEIEELIDSINYQQSACYIPQRFRGFAATLTLTRRLDPPHGISRAYNADC